MSVRKNNSWFLLLPLWSWAIIATLPACSPVGPNFQTPRPDMPAHWAEKSVTSSAATAAPLHCWWTLFQDPTLDSLITRALAANLDLRIAATRIREARAQRRLAAAASFPARGIGGGSTSSHSSENIPSGGVTQDLFRADFDASWEIDVFGGTRRQIEAAEATLAASVEDGRNVLVTLEAEVARNYLELRTSQQRLRIAGDNIRIQEKTAALVRNKSEIGLGGELEIAQAEALLALTRSEVPSLESTASQAIHQLALLLGQQPPSLQAELARIADIPPVPPLLPATLPSDLLRQRPDIRAAERQLAAATATVGAAIAELFPHFSLFALIGLQSTSLPDLVATSSRFWSAGPTVQWSLFDGGRTRAVIDFSEARRDRAQATYEKTVLTALVETENALVAYAREQERHKILGQAVASGQQALTLARGQYAAGLTPFLNVLVSENTLYQSQDKLIQSNQQLAITMVALYKALGGGWQTEAMAPVAAFPGIGPENSQEARNNP